MRLLKYFGPIVYHEEVFRVQNSSLFLFLFFLEAAQSNQIRVVAFNVPQLTQASFLQKKSNVAKCFFDICNAEMAQSLSSLPKSEFLRLIILIFHVKK